MEFVDFQNLLTIFLIFLLFSYWHKYIKIEKNINMKKSNIMSGALILSIGALLAKIFSAFYRILLTRVLGGEGIGIYQLIFLLFRVKIHT